MPPVCVPVRGVFRLVQNARPKKAQVVELVGPESHEEVGSDRLMSMSPLKPVPEEAKEKKLWFRAKRYGYGWYPATWQGWVVLGIYVCLILLASWEILGGNEKGVAAVKHFLLTVGILTFFLLYVCIKYGEPPRWRWGKDNDHVE